MNLREEILREHSKAQAKKLAAWIGDHASRFNELIALFLHDEYRVVQRAAWIVSTVAEKHPGLIAPHLEELVGRVEEPRLPVAVKRNVMRVLQHIPIPEALHGQVMNIAFRQLETPDEAVAVRVFSMQVLANLAVIYPDIKGELRIIIEDALVHGAATAGFRSRAKKVLLEIAKS